MRQRLVPILAIAVVLLAMAASTPVAAARGSMLYRFSAPVYVDRDRSGGEPSVMASRYGTLVYSAHQGLTHFYRSDAATAPSGDAAFAANNRNQVGIWLSNDGGKSWQRNDFMGTGFSTNPTINVGFSDPDLTTDESGRIYDTGIDLANASVFSSADGGRTWDKGTVNCHAGDRPWMAGGKPNELFFAVRAIEERRSGATLFKSTDGGSTCGSSGVYDGGLVSTGAFKGLTFYGTGKPVFDSVSQKLYMPAVLVDGLGVVSGVGLSVLSDDGTSFLPISVAHSTYYRGGIGGITFAIDAAHNFYLTWPTDVSSRSSSCVATGGPGPNAIKLAVSTNQGRTWKVRTLTQPGTSVFWPWMVAGDAGRVSVVWYQADTGTDVECVPSAISVRAAFVTNAASRRAKIRIVDPIGRPVHVGTVCMSGTVCVASGSDRRLGDYLTAAIDPSGCLLIATGDTRLNDPTTGQSLPTARPLFTRQDSGPPLTGNTACRA